MEEGKIQWHPAFGAALRIELAGELEKVQIEEEHLLGKSPLRIDIVLLKKKPGEKIVKNIGRIFRNYNIIEYKSPDDNLSIRDFYKVYAYACLYQAEEKKKIAPEELTITFVCNHYPRKLLKHITRRRGIRIERMEAGIYYLLGDFFPMQLIITKKLTKDKNFWLQSLRKDLKPGGEIQDLIEQYEPNKHEAWYQAVMNVVMRANWEAAEEERKMCEALRELFAEEIAEGEAKGMARGMEKGMAKGEERFGKLNLLLLENGQYESLKRASEDKDYREALFKEFGI